jgi:WD40 repeat protein
MSIEADASSTSTKGKRLALVIGVNNAPNSGLYPLNHAASDAQAIAEVLQQCCHFELLETPLIDEQAISDRVKKAIRKLARDRTDDDFLLLYFSGHGQPMTVEAEQSDVYFVTHDFDPIDVEEDEDSHCSMRWMWEKLYMPTQAGKVVVILDCCFAGNMGTVGPDPYLEELQARIKKYFGPPSSASGARSGGLRLALTATGHNTPAAEQGGYGVMTELLLPALRGEAAEALDDDGQVSLQRLFEYLQKTMPRDQQPSLAGDFAGRGRDCILASYPERAAELRKKRSHLLVKERPENYIPFFQDHQFQERPGEFEKLEILLFGKESERQPVHVRVGLVGVTGMAGVGKTQLAVELAYRYQDRFLDGIFWMPAAGKDLFEWQHQFAELAFNTGYLSTDDNPSSLENERRRAQHFCRYLAEHKNALLILDNVEYPNLVTSVLPILAGKEPNCAILYTSRNRITPTGMTTYAVEQLPESAALHLMLESTRPMLLSQIEAGSTDAEAQSARILCQYVGYLPLALVHLRGLLIKDEHMTLAHLVDVLRERGALDIIKTLDTTIHLSWDYVEDERAQHMFKLACYFPEAAPIPLWLLGRAAGLGESRAIVDPLGEVCTQLHELSLLEVLSGDQVRLHPLVCEFGRHLLLEDGERGATLRKEAGERLVAELTDLNRLEQRALRKGYWQCLEQVKAAREYAEMLEVTEQVAQIRLVEWWMDRESYLLGVEELWPTVLPELFYQQLWNRAVEEGHQLKERDLPNRWMQQMRQVGAEDRSLRKIFAGHLGPIWSVTFSPEGTSVLTGSEDRTTRLWETESGKLLMKLEGHSKTVFGVTFSTDGAKILTGSEDKTARLWETDSGKLLQTLEGHASAVRGVAFSPDGRRVLTGSEDRTARLWETASGRLLGILKSHKDWVTSVAFSPDGRRVLTGSYDGMARLWETASGRLLGILESHKDWVTSVAFSPDGRQALTGSYDGTTRLWETASGKLLQTLEGHASAVRGVAFSPDGRRVLTGSADKTSRLWEVPSGNLLTILEGHSEGVTSVAFSPDGRQVLTGSEDGTARLWNLTDSEIKTISSSETVLGQVPGISQGYTSEVTSMAFSPDGIRLVSGSEDGTARVWETAKGQVLRTLQAHSGKVTSMAFSPDGTWVVSGSEDDTARVWETAKGKTLTRLENPTGFIANRVLSVAFSSDGMHIVTGLEYGMAVVYSARTGRKVATLGGQVNRMTSVAYSPDGTKVLTGSDDGTVFVWETSSERVLSTLKGHSGSVNGVAFSPDARQVLTGSNDRTARLWETVSGRELLRLEGHSGGVRSVAFSPNGHLMMTCDSNGWTLFWQGSGVEAGQLVGMYVATYPVGAFYWQDATHIMLVDLGGPKGRPHFYRLKLEGKW